jgi:hypothetical protein
MKKLEGASPDAPKFFSSAGALPSRKPLAIRYSLPFLARQEPRPPTSFRPPVPRPTPLPFLSRVPCLSRSELALIYGLLHFTKRCGCGIKFATFPER